MSNQLSKEEEKLLGEVTFYLQKNSKLFSHLVNAMQAGLENKIEEMHLQCCASEKALFNIAFDKQVRAKIRKNEFVLEYLTKFPTYLRWDWLFEDDK